MTIELTTAAMFFLSSFFGSSPADVTQKEIAKSVLTPLSSAAVVQPLTLEEYVRLYYYDAPILAEIARCESRFRHLGANGRVIRGELSYEDVGVMQINEFYHEERAEKLGLNLHTLDGNLAYAKWLYGKEGVTPWLSSSRCWQKFAHLADGIARNDTGAN